MFVACGYFPTTLAIEALKFSMTLSFSPSLTTPRKGNSTRETIFLEVVDKALVRLTVKSNRY